MITGTDIQAGRRVNVAPGLHAHVWQDMADAVDDVINAAEWSGMSSRREGRSDWAGSESFGQAVDMLRGGWNEHRDAVEQAMAAVMDDPAIEEMISRRFAWQYDYAGGMADIGRFVTGEPECMLAPVMTESRQPDAVVRIVITGGAPANVDTETIVQRGIVVAALVDVLQKLGRGVEVWWAAVNTPGGGSSSRARRADLVKVKSTDEPLDVDDLLFVTASPAMLRRFGFALREMETTANRNKWQITEYGNYGQSADMTRDELAVAIDGPVHVMFGALKPGDNYRDPVGHVLRHLSGLQDVEL